MPTVLIIDDEPVNAELVQVYLKSQNINTLIATTGKEGYAIAKSALPDLIFTDLRMPYETWTGYDTIAKLKANPNTKHIPIIALTAAGDLTKAMELGCADLLHRPFKVHQLKNLLDRFLELSP